MENNCMGSKEEYLQQRIGDLQKQHLLRELTVIDGRQTPVTLVDGRSAFLFCSSNYLGLSEEPEVLAAAHEALDKYGSGSGGSRLTTGNQAVHEAVERAIADFTGFPKALLFTSGYHANVGTISAFADKACRDNLCI